MLYGGGQVGMCEDEVTATVRALVGGKSVLSDWRGIVGREMRSEGPASLSELL
jgi:hypothetical protein